MQKVDWGEAARTIEEMKRRGKIYQSATTNLTKSNDAKPPECSLCNDLGTTLSERWITDDSYTYNGRQIPHLVATITTCECHKQKIFDKYNASAGMKPSERERTFETSIIDMENKESFQKARQFVDKIEFHLKTGTWFYIYGDEERAKKENKSAWGTGKTHLTHCIGNFLTQRKQKAIYTTEDKLYQDIKSTYSRDSDETESEVMYRYENVPILLIDDMFKSKVTDWVEDKAFHLLNNRCTPGKVTIINSNYAPNRIEKTLEKNGKAIASRILGQAILMEMIGKDRRRQKARERYLNE